MNMQPNTSDIPPAEPGLRRFGTLAAVAAIYTYLLMVFGGIVRITGSGLGCGKDWPLCHGDFVPPMHLTTIIEYTHRLLALGLFIPVGLLLYHTWRHRHDDGFAGAGGALRPVALFLVLLVVQIALGAITVEMDLPPAVTVLHFLTASCIIATLLVAAVRGRRGGAHRPPLPSGWTGGAMVAGVLGFLAIGMGSTTANTGAAPACQGFPLCNGALLPAASPLVEVQWTHRLIAYALFLFLLYQAVLVWRRGAPTAVRAWASAAFGLAIAQVAVAAWMILAHLPEAARAIHLAVGLAVWCAIVVWVSVSRRVDPEPRAADPLTAVVGFRPTDA